MFLLFFVVFLMGKISFDTCIFLFFHVGLFIAIVEYIFFRLNLSMDDLELMVDETINYGETLLVEQPFIHDLGIGGPIRD